MFDENQEPFVQLKKVLAENTAPVYLWIGAGLSCAAGLPSWAELKTHLISRGRNFLLHQEHLEDRDRRNALLRVAELENDDLWTAFEYVYKALGSSEYEQLIRAEFNVANTCAIPQSVVQLLNLNVKGVITTNIDKIITRAFFKSQRESAPLEFTGSECGDYNYVLTTSQFFILHLHGFVDKISSLIMRKGELNNLMEDKGYKEFIGSVFSDKIVLFVGVNPMDKAVRCHLDRIRHLIRGNVPMYWITDNTSKAAFDFSNEYNVRRIVYSSGDNHKDFSRVIDLLCNGKSYDDENPVPGYFNVPPIERSIRHLDELEKLPNDVVREVLNKKACSILRDGTSESYKAYTQFLQKYKRYIHNAWFVEQGSKLLGLTIGDEIGDGAFGRVFQAVDAKGVAYAVKLLKLDVMRKPACLQSFRRGVRTMEILSRKGIDGIVKYKFASEIPAFVAMELVEGANLYDVVRQRQLNTWFDKLRVLTEVGKIIKAAHALPERVLHRDIRPQNIMLRGFDYNSTDWDVCVLDFDLAFHKGSNEVSMQMASGVNGFLAPEQTDLSSKAGQTRSGRVDSYGFAMLCYFVITGKTPRPEQCLQEGWHQIVDENVGSLTCERWKSLPYKLAWLIKKCTAYNQDERLDLYQMYDFLSVLNMAIRNADTVNLPELILDELTYRFAIPLKSQNEVKIDLDGHRRLTRHGGTNYRFGMDGHDVYLTVEWHSAGNVEYSLVKKRLSDRANALVERLKKVGFKNVTLRFEGSGALIELLFDIKSYRIRQLEQLVAVLIKNDIVPCVY